MIEIRFDMRREWALTLYSFCSCLATSRLNDLTPVVEPGVSIYIYIYIYIYPSPGGFRSQSTSKRPFLCLIQLFDIFNNLIVFSILYFSI